MEDRWAESIRTSSMSRAISQPRGSRFDGSKAGPMWSSDIGSSMRSTPSSTRAPPGSGRKISGRRDFPQGREETADGPSLSKTRAWPRLSGGSSKSTSTSAGAIRSPNGSGRCRECLLLRRCRRGPWGRGRITAELAWSSDRTPTLIRTVSWISWLPRTRGSRSKRSTSRTAGATRPIRSSKGRSTPPVAASP